jgi:NAD(P)H dehydrogenase (quinone)
MAPLPVGSYLICKRAFSECRSERDGIRQSRRTIKGAPSRPLLGNPEAHIGKTIPLSGPVEMDHEQMAKELSEALGRKIVFQDLPIDEYCTSIEAMGVPPYVVLQHLRGAMADYQTGHMSGADNNIEKLTGRRSMTVGEFARAHADVLSAKPAAA